MAAAGLGRNAAVPPPPPRPAPPAPRPAEDVPSPAATEAVKPPSPQASPAPVDTAAAVQQKAEIPTPRRARSYADDISVPITLTQPVALVQWVREVRTMEQTVADIVLMAISNNIEALPERVAELRNSKGGRKEGMFTLSAPKAEAPTGPLQIHTRTSNVEMIDRLVIKVGAENRSQLVRAALELASNR